MRQANRLTALKVSKARKPGRYADGGGLYLQVSTAHTKAWLFWFMRNGRAREMGLGPVDIVSLADAREKTREARKLLLEGVDPIETRRAARLKVLADEAKIKTFQDCAVVPLNFHPAAIRALARGVSNGQRAELRGTAFSSVCVWQARPPVGPSGRQAVPCG